MSRAMRTGMSSSSALIQTATASGEQSSFSSSSAPPLTRLEAMRCDRFRSDSVRVGSGRLPSRGTSYNWRRARPAGPVLRRLSHGRRRRPAGLGWVGRVAVASFAAGTPLTAYNLGVRGETSLQVASRWRLETRARLLPGADTRMVVSFGANDTTIEDGVQRVEAERSCGALDDILERARSIDLPTLVVGPAPVDDAEQSRLPSARSAPREQCPSSALPSRCWPPTCGANRLPAGMALIRGRLATRRWPKSCSRADGSTGSEAAQGQNKQSRGRHRPTAIAPVYRYSRSRCSRR